MKTSFLTAFLVNLLLSLIIGYEAMAEEQVDPLIESAMEIWSSSQDEIDMEGKNVEYTGYNGKGESFSLFSKSVLKKGNQILLKDIEAKMLAPDSGGIYFNGDEGVFYLEENIFYFTKGGNILTSHGISMNFEKAKIDLNQGEAKIIGNICLGTPLGRFVVDEVNVKKLGDYVSLPSGINLEKGGSC